MSKTPSTSGTRLVETHHHQVDASNESMHENPTTAKDQQRQNYNSVQEEKAVSPREEAETDSSKTKKEEFPSSKESRNSISKLKFDPELAELLEDHLKFTIPLSDCCVDSSSSIGSENEERRKNVLKISPALSFLIYTFLFYIPILWSSLKPLFFPPSIASVGNFDSCFMVNQTALNETSKTSSSSSSSSPPSYLVPISFINCILCNDEKGYVPLQPALTELTSFALWLRFAFSSPLPSAAGSSVVVTTNA